MLRQRKHKVYGLGNGKNFVRSSTPCKSGDLNDLHNLRRLLGLNKTEFMDGERRERKVKATNGNGYTPARFSKPSFNSTLADKLQAVGLTEDVMRDEIAMLNYEVETLREELQSQMDELIECDAVIVGLELRTCECWWCKVKGWTRSVL